MSQRDLNQFDNLEEQKFILSRRIADLDTYRDSTCRYCNKCIRPFNIVVGVVTLILEALIALSLILTK